MNECRYILLEEETSAEQNNKNTNYLNSDHQVTCESHKHTHTCTHKHTEIQSDLHRITTTWIPALHTQKSNSITDVEDPYHSGRKWCQQMRSTHPTTVRTSISPISLSSLSSSSSSPWSSPASSCSSSLTVLSSFTLL